MSNQIQPTYVTFEQAKWLSEKQFYTHCLMVYAEERRINLKTGGDIFTGVYNLIPRGKFQKRFYLAPEQHQVVEWLRVNHGIWIEVGIDESENIITYYSIIHKIEKLEIYRKQSSKLGIGVKKEIFDMSSPQEAYSSAFSYVLSKLI